jgi:hypothetical protein
LRRVQHGSVDAWVWGDGHAPPSDDLTFEAICKPPTPVATSPQSSPTPIVPDAPGGTQASKTPTLPAATATAEPIETGPPVQTPTGPAVATAPLPTAVPSSAANVAPSLAGYWPFGLMLLGLGTIGTLVWLRRT